MEKKSIALVLIALLAGLGGGFGLGYVIYQPQILNLQNAINDFNDRLDAANNRLDSINSTLRSTQSSVNILNSGIAGLNSTIANLNSTVEKIENRTWHQVTNLEWPQTLGSTFQIKGEMIRVQWIMYGAATTAIIQIHLRFSDGTPFADRGSSGAFGEFSCDITSGNLPNEYYIEIDGLSLAYYKVVVWDYY